MDSNLKKLIPFALTYKKNIFFNVFFNIFYALFSTLLMVSMIPTLNVLFGLNEKVTSPPIFNGIGSIKQYSEQFLNYKITSLTANYDFKIALLFVISIIISTAFLKNAANYLQKLKEDNPDKIKEYAKKAYLKQKEKKKQKELINENI